LPTVTPSMMKRHTTDAPTPGLRTTEDGMTQPRGGRETVLLTTVKKATPPASPAVATPTMITGRPRPPAEAAPPRPPRIKRARPGVGAAEIRSTKQTVSSPSAGLVLLDQKLLAQGAAIRSLRHRLADRGDPHVALVSSAVPKEGKSFCAANLALALAEIRRSRVLLMEANVHGPALAEFFGLRKPSSVFAQVEAHRHDITVPWNTIELSTHDLHVLVADPADVAPRSIDGALFATCLDSLRGAYDYIIIDGPSVSAGPDVSLLEDAVDGILFTTRSGKSSAQALRHALDQISPQDLLGVVMLDA
jgi:Mrp family chromosome partitioning ATPase